ncbi:hypothetical protein EV401DRAFT_2062149 [Pisolithus croceorrhizus]|nr:hypothetical protein EV401DRAFT_2062149 [Pisolithus croceorrhizus]
MGQSDKEFEADPEFHTFQRHLFHPSLEAIFHAMHPAMTKPQSVKCADGHYHRTIYGLGPSIADYPEQALLACIVQGWCPKCTAHQTHLDHDPNAILHNHEYTQLLMDSLLHMYCGKTSFPHANFHELIAPDILHQIIKGTFKDHLVSWVETYLKKHYKNDFAAVLADIDCRIVVVPPFPGLQHFSQGHGFKQWTGNDSKALMKVYLPAIAGYVPNEMLQALSAFIDFCYIVHQSSLGEADLEALDKALQCFETHCSIFELFGAPNGLSTSIVESKYIHAVQRPYQQSNKNEEMAQVLLDTSFQDDPYLQEADDDDSERVDAMVQLAHKPSPRKLRTLAEMGQDIGHPELPDLVSIFLFQQRNPGDDVPDISKCPKAIDPGYSFSSAVATLYAPSDLSGAYGMHCQCIHASPSWRNGAPHYDCVFVEKDPTLPGFQGLYVAQVLLFFSFHYQNWFTPIGNEPFEHEYDEYGDHLVTHLIGIYDSLAAFGSFYVNKYSDCHAFGLAF